jgi:hypothetical protein
MTMWEFILQMAYHRKNVRLSPVFDMERNGSA